MTVKSLLVQLPISKYLRMLHTQKVWRPERANNITGKGKGERHRNECVPGKNSLERRESSLGKALSYRTVLL
jgi:hypothetical protein